MDTLCTAWRDDRLQFGLAVLYLVIGLTLLIRHSDRWVLVAGVLLFGAGVAQAYEVLVLRPRRLERTGSRRAPRWGSR